MALKKDKNVIDHLPRDEKLILFIFLQEDINRKQDVWPCMGQESTVVSTLPYLLLPMGRGGYAPHRTKFNKIYLPIDAQ